MPDLVALYGWPMLAAMAAAAMVVGFSKTSFGGIANLAVAVFALAMPTKESTAAILLLLIVGDMVAIARYRTVSWRLLVKLVPGVIPGLLLGALFMSMVDDTLMRRSIGALLLVMLIMQLWQRRTAGRPESPTDPHWARAAATGTAAGFTTMTANAAGPVMALYFLAAGIDKQRFIGTNAWFFAIINLSKVPLAAQLGLFTPQSLFLDLTLIPAVLLGAWIGTWVIGKVTQRQFELITIGASGLASVLLLLR
ncbi:MAG: sulfite exporter TauE/SafE family protein [Propioniciclava sp.]|uniref:sulfite exporter TauE/SafE family protein n=1 Tax=Propioniciclava sp. TaxID=2038686 RepID=UPI0039E391DF